MRDLTELEVRDFPVAILAGGLATRLRPVTAKIPKSLVSVAGEPFLAHQLRLLHAQGVRRAVLCIGHLGEMIESDFGNGEAFGVELAYSYDGAKLRGTGGAIAQALPLLGDAFFVLYGDSYLPIDYAAVARDFTASGKPGLMTVFHNNGAFDRSNVLYQDGAILAYDKHHPTPEMRHIDYGLGMFRASAFQSHAESDAFDLAELQHALVASGDLAGHAVQQRFYEIGSHEGLRELDMMLSDDPLCLLPELSSSTMRQPAVS